MIQRFVKHARAILLSSGIKALDHAVEALCAVEANHFAAPLASGRSNF